MAHATVTKIAKLRAHLHRDRPKRKKKPVVVQQSADEARNTTSLSNPDADDDGLDDISTLTSADEFDAEVHEWFRELELEALEDEDDEPGSCSSVIRSVPLAEIFGSALEPLLSEEDLCRL